MYEYRAMVIRVHDGDTLWLTVDLGFDVHLDIAVRLNGLDAPELSTQAGKDVRDWLIGALPPGTIVRLNTDKDHHEKYGRYLGTITKLGGPNLAEVNINDALLASGMARPYDGGKR